MDTLLSPVDTLARLVAALSELDARIAKGADLLSQPQHWRKDDELTLKYESAWLELSRQHALRYEELLTAWKESGAALEWEFPAGAPVALPVGWTCETDGTLCARLTYEEFRICVMAVTTEEELKL